jgi:hypothetical protein
MNLRIGQFPDWRIDKTRNLANAVQNKYIQNELIEGYAERPGSWPGLSVRN